LCIWLHAAFDVALIFGSPHRHNTTSKVGRVNCVLADSEVLRCVSGERAGDWPDFVPLIEFTIIDSASPLGSGYTPFYANSGQHPRRSLVPPPAPDLAGSGEAATDLMGRVTTEVRALLQERQPAGRTGAELDAQRRDVRFALGEEVLLDRERLPSLRLPRWMGPFRCSRDLNIYLLEIPATRLPRNQRCASAPVPARVCRSRIAQPAAATPAPQDLSSSFTAGTEAAGAAQVPDALRPPARAGALGGPGPRPVRWHV
jgi:hypothetical protein